jgi:hypothetical protein
MKIMIPFKNSKTSQIKRVKLGFSWTLFLFSGFFGIPLFMRGLMIWGGIMAILWAGSIIAMQTFPVALVSIYVVEMFLAFYLGFRGNKLTALHYLENGWEFYDPHAEFTRMAKQSWGMMN